MNLETVLRLVALISGAGVLLSTFEYLYSYDRLDDEGLLSWELSKYHRAWSQAGLLAKLADHLFEYSRFKWLLVIRGVAGALVVVFAILDWNAQLLFLVVFLTTYSITLRNAYGLDGAFQLTLVIYAALFIASIFPNDSVIAVVCVWFIGLQAILSYFVSGVSKLVSPTWRNGDALPGIFGTDIYGHQTVFRLIRDRPRVSQFLCWSVIVVECLFPLVLFADLPLAIFLLGWGFLFHLSTAVFMGLNVFFVTFLSTYPAILYVNGTVTNFI